MRRGTTPTNTFASDVDLTGAEVMYITYKQAGKTVIEKTLPDVTFGEDSFSVDLTQEETLRFNSQQEVEIQVRVKFMGDEAIASNIIKTTVGRILKDGEI